jgi:orotidine-5'-phosphate decarboxylase
MANSHFADRLTRAVRGRCNSVCVGLDPRWELLPEDIRTRHQPLSLEAAAAAFEEFCLRVLDVVAPLVPVVKPQSAFFEACGPAGLVALQNVLRRARELGLLTILDSKRNDIASTAEAYADAAFAGVRRLRGGPPGRAGPLRLGRRRLDHQPLPRPRCR